MSPDAAIARAQRWQAFYAEPGGIGDMLARLTAEHMREAVACEPWETDRLKKVALSLKIIGELEQAIRGVAADGKLAERAAEHAERVANIPERKRKWL